MSNCFLKLTIRLPFQKKNVTVKDRLHTSYISVISCHQVQGMGSKTLPSLVPCFTSNFLPLKLLTAPLWHQSALFPQAQVWQRNCWLHWEGEREREREKEGEFANSTNRPTSDFAARISFRFLANGWLHGMNVYPIQEGWKRFWCRAQTPGFQSHCDHNQSLGGKKSP